MVLGTLYGSLTTEEKRPIAEPNLIDIESVHSRLANILFRQRSDEEDTGHVSKVESLEGHHHRVGDPSAVLPTPPTKSKPPTDATSKHLFTVYRWNLYRYNTYKDWDQDVINVIRVLFPNGLTDKEIDTEGMLPLALTGQLITISKQAFLKSSHETSNITDINIK